MGLVAVTNAEKVILDRIVEKGGQISFFDESHDEKDKAANELRNLIGKLPNISIIIDEVHHAVSDEIKLRAVVNKWTENDTVNSVIGFSGTPYLEKAEKVEIADLLTIANSEINNIAYYYPLINGVGNFLKLPIVKISNSEDSLEIVEAGLRLFLNNYKDVRYKGNLLPKLGIYCGKIEKLEQQIYPLVARVVSEYGLNPVETVLKFHKGNKEYQIPTDSQLQFDSLDKSISKIRIVLLVQIGKEGWDCKSLTGIILSQEGDCPKNMVLQTSCRCLRQVEKYAQETALIYLNESNAAKLNEQLQQQHHISIRDLETASSREKIEIKRYDRTAYLRLPKVSFYQLKVSYKTLIIEESVNTEEEIREVVKADTARTTVVKTQDFNQMVQEIDTTGYESGKEVANFNNWLYTIAKESFGVITVPMLRNYELQMRAVFEEITYADNSIRYFSSKYKIKRINSNIRKSFYEKRTFESFEELIPQEASLLNIANFKEHILTTTPENYYPDAVLTEKIIADDKGKLKIDKKTQQLLELAEETGQTVIVEQIRKQLISHPMKEKSFHYLPYKTDSQFEQTFLQEVLLLTSIKEKDLEVYYNGDRSLTEFKIKCYKQSNGKWQYIGMYTPDFLIISRKNGVIHKAIIVETKGEIYANDPMFRDKKHFVENHFKRKNNEVFGFERFDYLYLEDTMTESERILETAKAIDRFFKEDK
jgi:superfamily II DNA or RNA helicase